MKYLAAYIATVVVAWLAWHDDRAPELIPEWVLMAAGPLIITLPPALLTHAFTRKIGGPKSRIVDLAILFVVVGAFWALSTDLTAGGIVRSPLRFWLGLTLTSWATFFVPFSLTLAIVEGWQSRQKSAIAQR